MSLESISTVERHVTPPLSGGRDPTSPSVNYRWTFGSSRTPGVTFDSHGQSLDCLKSDRRKLPILNPVEFLFTVNQICVKKFSEIKVKNIDSRVDRTPYKRNSLTSPERPVCIKVFLSSKEMKIFKQKEIKNIQACQKT